MLAGSLGRWEARLWRGVLGGGLFRVVGGDSVGCLPGRGSVLFVGLRLIWGFVAGWVVGVGGLEGGRGCGWGGGGGFLLGGAGWRIASSRFWLLGEGGLVGCVMVRGAVVVVFGVRLGWGWA